MSSPNSSSSSGPHQSVKHKDGKSKGLNQAVNTDMHAGGLNMAMDVSNRGVFFPTTYSPKDQSLINDQAREYAFAAQSFRRPEVALAAGLINKPYDTKHKQVVDNLMTDFAQFNLERFIQNQLYDPNTIEGGRALDRLLPGVKNRSKAFVTMALKQMEFIINNAMKPQFDSVQEIDRIIRIIGAGEPLIYAFHPAIRGIFGDAVPNLGVDDSTHMYNYFQRWDAGNPWFQNKHTHRPMRKKIARMMAHKIPKLLGGNTDSALGAPAGGRLAYLETGKTYAQGNPAYSIETFVHACEDHVQRSSVGAVAEKVYETLGVARNANPQVVPFGGGNAGAMANGVGWPR